MYLSNSSLPIKLSDRKSLNTNYRTKHKNVDGKKKEKTEKGEYWTNEHFKKSKELTRSLLYICKNSLFRRKILIRISPPFFVSMFCQLFEIIFFSFHFFEILDTESFISFLLCVFHDECSLNILFRCVRQELS